MELKLTNTALFLDDVLIYFIFLNWLGHWDLNSLMLIVSILLYKLVN